MRYFALLLFAFSTSGAEPQAARDLNDRGLAAYARGDYAAAERLYLEAIPQWQALGEAYSAHLAITRMNLGSDLAAQGRRAEALPQLEESLAVLRRTLGVGDRRTLDCINSLAGLELMRDNYERADALLGEALGAERESFPASVTLARTLSETAILRLRQGRIAEALPAAEESLALAAKTAGEDSVEAALAYTAVAEAHRLANRPERALPLYRRARAIYEKRLGPGHPRVASMLGQEAVILAGEGELASAAEELRHALAILDKSCPGCVYERWTLDSDLAQVRILQGKYAEAERLLTEALALCEKAHATAPADAERTRNALAEVRQKEEHAEKAEGRGRKGSSGVSQ